MKLLLLILLLSPHAQASYSLSQSETKDLLCGYIDSSPPRPSCVSKASIKRDLLQAELIELQIAELKNKQLTNKKKPVSINN